MSLLIGIERLRKKDSENKVEWMGINHKGFKASVPAWQFLQFMSPTNPQKQVTDHTCHMIQLKPTYRAPVILPHH